jgi:hypothetical protein
MKLLWTALFTFLGQALAVAATVSTPVSAFHVADNWSLLPRRGPETFTLRSAERDIEVNVLAQVAAKVTPENLKFATSQFLAAAIDQHEKAAASWHLTLSNVESNVSLFPGRAIAEFFGSDSSGRRFRQIILVQPGSAVSLYADTKSASQEALQAAVSELVQGMQNEP